MSLGSLQSVLYRVRPFFVLLPRLFFRVRILPPSVEITTRFPLNSSSNGICPESKQALARNAKRLNIIRIVLMSSLNPYNVSIKRLDSSREQAAVANKLIREQIADVHLS